MGKNTFLSIVNLYLIVKLVLTNSKGFFIMVMFLTLLQKAVEAHKNAEIMIIGGAKV